MPEEFTRRQGVVTAATQDKIKEFVNAGGTVVYIGDVTMAAAQAFNLPVTNHLEGLGQDKFYVPGSVLRMTVDPNDPVAHGMNKEMDVFFDNDPVFKLGADAAAKGVRPVGWFATDDPLRSGWAVGQEKLKGSTGVLDIDVGKGKLFVMGPEVTQRAQSYGTFKFLFNGILASNAERSSMR